MKIKSPFGMINTLSSFPAGVAQLVERDLAKVEVVGSSPIARSIKKQAPFRRLFFAFKSSTVT